jgi:hypothetical protein
MMGARSAKLSILRRLKSWHVLCLTACAGTIGCGQSLPADPPLHPVHGVVKLDGEPICGGRVRFARTGDQGQGGQAPVDAEGKYEANAVPTKLGLPAGEYKVSVIPRDVTEHSAFECDKVDKIPQKYQSFDDSGLTYTVTSGDNEYDIDLTSGSAETSEE